MRETKTPPLTPEQFLDAIREREDNDAEGFHMETDRLMEDLLCSLGYRLGIERIRRRPRWYA